MTIKELIDFTGKTERTLRRWIEKSNIQGCDKMSYQMERNYTIDEVEKILCSGSMSKDAVSILMQNAKTPAIENNSMMQMFTMMMQQQQQFMSAVLGEIKNISAPKQLQLEQPKQDYFSLLAYCNLKQIKITHSESILHGKALRRICNENNKELRAIPDERWGKVNSYPVDVLEEYFTV